MSHNVRGSSPICVMLALLPEFSNLSMSAAFDAFSIANRIAGKLVFQCNLCSEDGKPVSSSSGRLIQVDSAFVQLRKDDILLMIGGTDVRGATNPKVLNWLRHQAAHGVGIGALCTGTYVLAKAGLLNHHKATVHWEEFEKLVEEFPDINFVKRAYVADGNRFSTAGGTSSIDLALNIISRMVGEDLASAVAVQMNYSWVRSFFDSAELSLPRRLNIRNPRVSAVLRLMEETIEEPVSSHELAEHAGMSARHLERLFNRFVGMPPGKYYRELRLTRARNLLLGTQLSVIEIACACGYVSPSHFSKNFREKYNISPHSIRKQSGQHHAEQ